MAKINSGKNKWLLPILLYLLLVLLCFPVFAETEARCDDYVSSSLLQNREKVVNNCFFGGSRWNDNAAGQKKWCLGVSETALSLETAERSKGLAACKKARLNSGKRYHSVKKNCLPRSFKQFKNTNANLLHQCLSVGTNAIKGTQGGVSYLSYLHNFGQEYYLFNFVGRGQNATLKTHRIGSLARCNSGSFSLARSGKGIAILGECSSYYLTENGYESGVSSITGGSSDAVGFELSNGFWRPTFSYYKSLYDNQGDTSHTEYLYDFNLATYYEYSHNYMSFSTYTSSVSVGELLNKPESLGVGSFYPQARGILKSEPSVSSSCYDSNKDDGISDQEACDYVVEIREQFNNKGSRFNEIQTLY